MGWQLIEGSAASPGLGDGLGGWLGAREGGKAADTDDAVKFA